jgi:nucleoside 2-deoxyribosyltransferase
MNKITVYLAGDLLKPHWRDEVMKLQDDFEGIEFVIPMELEQSSVRDPKVYVPRDIVLINKADVVFAFIRDAGHKYSGTSAEIGMAKALGKTIIVVILNEAKYTNQFNFITQIADSVCNDLNKGIEILTYMIL